jgi:hypothetical protein
VRDEWYDYQLVGAGADIVAGVGATSITSFHHGTLVGAGAGQPIQPLMYLFHATIGQRRGFQRGHRCLRLPVTDRPDDLWRVGRPPGPSFQTVRL